ncbi:hypothetical protein AB1Y20_013462 [Prymnesium parvum]|uniref:Uncharacterized protein n=1 Tax=Prymnesium parvum TaxID=97485 RepID=A0AB34IJ51_PRYPA
MNRELLVLRGLNTAPSLQVCLSSDGLSSTSVGESQDCPRWSPSDYPHVLTWRSLPKHSPSRQHLAEAAPSDRSASTVPTAFLALEAELRRHLLIRIRGEEAHLLDGYHLSHVEALRMAPRGAIGQHQRLGCGHLLVTVSLCGAPQLTVGEQRFVLRAGDACALFGCEEARYALQPTAHAESFSLAFCFICGASIDIAVQQGRAPLPALPAGSLVEATFSEATREHYPSSYPALVLHPDAAAIYTLPPDDLPSLAPLAAALGHPTLCVHPSPPSPTSLALLFLPTPPYRSPPPHADVVHFVPRHCMVPLARGRLGARGSAAAAREAECWSAALEEVWRRGARGIAPRGAALLQLRRVEERLCQLRREQHLLRMEKALLEQTCAGEMEEGDEEGDSREAVEEKGSEEAGGMGREEAADEEASADEASGLDLSDDEALNINGEGWRSDSEDMTHREVAVEEEMEEDEEESPESNTEARRGASETAVVSPLIEAEDERPMEDDEVSDDLGDGQEREDTGEEVEGEEEEARGEEEGHKEGVAKDAASGGEASKASSLEQRKRMVAPGRVDEAPSAEDFSLEEDDVSDEQESEGRSEGRSEDAHEEEPRDAARPAAARGRQRASREARADDQWSTHCPSPGERVRVWWSAYDSYTGTVLRVHAELHYLCFTVQYDNGRRIEHSLSRVGRGDRLRVEKLADERRCIRLCCAITCARLVDPAKGERCRHAANCNFDALREVVRKGRGCPVAGCAFQRELRTVRHIQRDKALCRKLTEVPLSVSHVTVCEDGQLEWESATPTGVVDLTGDGEREVIDVSSGEEEAPFSQGKRQKVLPFPENKVLI